MERVLIALQFIIKVCQMVDTQMWRRGSDTHVQNLMTHQTMLALGRWWSCYFVVLVHLYFMQSRPKQSASLFNDVDTRGQPWWSCKSVAARNELNRLHIDEDNDYGDEDDEGDDNDVWIKRSDRKGGIPQLPILLLPSSSAQYRQPIICIDRIITVFVIINIVIILLHQHRQNHRHHHHRHHYHFDQQCIHNIYSCRLVSCVKIYAAIHRQHYT